MNESLLKVRIVRPSAYEGSLRTKYERGEELLIYIRRRLSISNFLDEQEIRWKYSEKQKKGFKGIKPQKIPRFLGGFFFFSKHCSGDELDKSSLSSNDVVCSLFQSIVLAMRYFRGRLPHNYRLRYPV